MNMIVDLLIIGSTGGAIGYVYNSLHKRIAQHENELANIKKAVQSIRADVAKMRQSVHKTDCPYKVGQPLKFFYWNERTKEMEPHQGKVSNVLYDKSEIMVEVKTKQFTYTLPLSKIVLEENKK